jgi:hypothetical protein
VTLRPAVFDRLLRARPERPCRHRSAEKCYQLPPFQVIELHSVRASQGQITGYRIGEDQSGGNATILQPVSRARATDSVERPPGGLAGRRRISRSTAEQPRQNPGALRRFLCPFQDGLEEGLPRY